MPPAGGSPAEHGIGAIVSVRLEGARRARHLVGGQRARLLPNLACGRERQPQLCATHAARCRAPITINSRAPRPRKPVEGDLGAIERDGSTDQESTGLPAHCVGFSRDDGQRGLRRDTGSGAPDTRPTAYLVDGKPTGMLVDVVTEAFRQDRPLGGRQNDAVGAMPQRGARPGKSTASSRSTGCRSANSFSPFRMRS